MMAAPTRRSLLCSQQGPSCHTRGTRSKNSPNVPRLRTSGIRGHVRRATSWQQFRVQQTGCASQLTGGARGGSLRSTCCHAARAAATAALAASHHTRGPGWYHTASSGGAPLARFSVLLCLAHAAADTTPCPGLRPLAAVEVTTITASASATR